MLNLMWRVEMREMEGIKRDITKILKELGYKPSTTELGLRVQIKDLSVDCKSFMSNRNATIFEDLNKESRIEYGYMVRAIMLLKELYKRKYDKQLKI
jgi:hypothetical protein|tara:strand:- start:310 stop:600 length:291 start_codon:yes stop_codon:yes gene_type:complete